MLARSAARELAAPRALGPHDTAPTLGSVNGIGTGFYGRRDEWPDRSYATTHCFSVLWIPIYPLGAWRVRAADGGYHVLAREQLSWFARLVRWLLPAAVVLVIVSAAALSYLHDPERLARQRWDAALEAAHTGDAEAALQRLDDEMAHDVDQVDIAHAERAGAEIVRLAAGRVARPLTAAVVDQATRVVRRYRALPRRAQGGAAQDAILDALDGWSSQLGTGGDTAEARLELLRAGYDLAFADRRARLAGQLVGARVALATSRQADWPLEALATLVEHTGAPEDAPAIEAADKLVAQLAESPSLLLDAGGDLDTWMASTTAADTRSRVAEVRKRAEAGRAEAEAEAVTGKQLADQQAKRPWDQYVALQLARGEASAGKLEAAAARLTRLGALGATIRDARLLLAQLTAAQGKLDAADDMLGSLLGSRLTRFAAASSAVNEAGKQAQSRLERLLDTGQLPLDLRNQWQAADERRRRELITQWYQEQLQADPGLTAARAKYVALGDVVPAALAAGSIKLRRAQAMSGPARNAMLEDAERTFLAIRGEAEGRPEFRLALGEIYARLGKTAESDAELGKLLAGTDQGLRFAVASVYRSLGNAARAMEVARDVFAAASGRDKTHAAALLGTMERDRDHEDEAEAWYRKAGDDDPGVAAALLDLEARRLERAGKTTECADKLAQVAKLHLANAGSTRTSGYNNAALAYESSFDCSSDPRALRDAEATLEKAYRETPDDAIVVGNLAGVLDSNGRLRVLARHVDVRALRLRLTDVASVLAALLDSPERDGVLAELAAEPGIRRSADLEAQAVILAPSRSSAYRQQFAEAAARRDVVAAQQVVARARQVKALDTTSAAAERARWISGAMDAQRLAGFETALARLEPIVARAGATVGGGLDARTRAVGWYLVAEALAELGLYKKDPARLVRAREAAVQAMGLWRALDGNALAVRTLLDEAGLAAGADAWIAARRLRSANGAIGQLADDHAPLATAIRASKPWSEIAGYARADQTRPAVSDLRLARLLGDTDLEGRARAVLDDPLARLGLELELLFEPTDAASKADLAYLDVR